MVSEAVGAGKSVLLLKLGNGKLPTKHQRFQHALAENGLLNIVDVATFRDRLTHTNGTAGREVMNRQSKQIQEALKKLL